jgi:hypothetical protein
MQIINSQIYNNIFHYIDRKLCDSRYDYDRWMKNGVFSLIIFSNETVKDRINIKKDNIGQYYPNKIVIHRSLLTIPDYSLLHETTTLFHEYGHHLSLLAGNYNREENIFISEMGVNYDLDQSPINIIFREECNAWKYALRTIYRFDLSLIRKIFLLIYASYSALFALHGYRMAAEGIIG